MCIYIYRYRQPQAGKKAVLSFILLPAIDVINRNSLNTDI